MHAWQTEIVETKFNTICKIHFYFNIGKTSIYCVVVCDIC